MLTFLGLNHNYNCNRRLERGMNTLLLGQSSQKCKTEKWQIL